MVAYVIAEPCIGIKDTACVDACPVDCIHPKKNTTYDDGRPGFGEVPQLHSEELRAWCERNRNRCYIPEGLLDAWDILVEPDLTGTA